MIRLRESGGGIFLGRPVGRLTPVGHQFRRGRQFWVVCQCECGSFGLYQVRSINDGDATSCGCYRSEKLSERNRRHDLSGTRIYRIWKNIKSRCGNENVPSYENYGAVGVEVCDEWKDDPKAFADWAFANGYSDDLTIDRKRSGEGYSPGNCQWITLSENSQKARREELSSPAKRAEAERKRKNTRFNLSIGV